VLIFIIHLKIQVHFRKIVLLKNELYCIILRLRIRFLQTSRDQGAERMRDIDPTRSFYVVDVDAIEEQKTDIYSMVIPCIANYSRLDSIVEITLQHKTFASREWVQVYLYLYN